jgi:hypothetical protein
MGVSTSKAVVKKKEQERSNKRNLVAMDVGLRPCKIKTSLSDRLGEPPLCGLGEPPLCGI